jgi:tetratricopeptide (TPR) repeat protein
MLSGVRPFRAGHDEAFIHSIRHDEPEPIDRLKPDVPGAVVRIVERCLTKDPDRRYSHVQDLVVDLQRRDIAQHVVDVPGGRPETGEQRRLSIDGTSDPDAEELDPLSPASHIEQGITLYVARRHDEAIARFRRLLEVSPQFTYAYFFLALVHVQKQEYETALAALDKVGAGQRPHDVETLRAYIHAVTGRSADARAGLERLKSLSPDSHVSSWHLAMIHLALGERDRAMDRLEQAYRDRAWELRLLPIEPLFDALRSDPRFGVLVEKVRLSSANNPDAAAAQRR